MFDSINLFAVTVSLVVLATILLLLALCKNKNIGKGISDSQNLDEAENSDFGVAQQTDDHDDTLDCLNLTDNGRNVMKNETVNEVGGLGPRQRPDTGGLPYVLVAEDNISNYKLIEVFLRNVALTENAINGKKAVERVKENDYDMVLMDIKMPVMNGLEATKAIRQFDKDIPIIAVTANVLDFDKKTALANGCNEFVTKPVVRNQLCAVVDAYKRK